MEQIEQLVDQIERRGKEIIGMRSSDAGPRALNYIGDIVNMTLNADTAGFEDRRMLTEAINGIAYDVLDEPYVKQGAFDGEPLGVRMHLRRFMYEYLANGDSTSARQWASILQDELDRHRNGG